MSAAVDPIATVAEERLTDGSHVYNVVLADTAVKIAAIDKGGADAIAQALNAHAAYSEVPA